MFYCDQFIRKRFLPNLAYVGGPSEITYWLELKFVFNELKLNMPILMLRNCAMVADRSTIAKWSKLGFQTVDLFRPENELIRTFLESKNLAQFSLTESSEKLSAIFDKISLEISNVDHSLKATADSEKQKALNSLKLIEEKVVRAMKRKEETEVNQIIKVREKFFPGDTLQERHDTLLPFYLKWGNEFIEEIKKSFDPFDKNFVLLEEK
ncbi:MAG: bacillithiol biosynthesis BshC [Bacteroidetes bacterium]|nr:bacillithiol biosynthesis BshC [Bacteroidota bacterium]